MLIPVSDKFNDYGNKILQELKNNDIRAEINDNNETLGKRIRNAEIQKIPYILVVGDKEMRNKTVNVRRRGQPASAPADTKALTDKEGLSAETSVKAEEIKIEKLIEKIKKEIENKII